MFSPQLRQSTQGCRDVTASEAAAAHDDDDDDDHSNRSSSSTTVGPFSVLNRSSDRADPLAHSPTTRRGREGERERKTGEMANSGYLCTGRRRNGSRVSRGERAQKRPTDQKINPPVDSMDQHSSERRGAAIPTAPCPKLSRDLGSPLSLSRSLLESPEI